MRHQALRVFLEAGHDGDIAGTCLGEVERSETVRANREIDRSGREKLHVVDRGAALADGHVETRLLVKAQSEGFIKTAVLGFGLPVGDKGDLRVRSRRWLEPEGQGCSHTCKHGQPEPLTHERSSFS